MSFYSLACRPEVSPLSGRVEEIDNSEWVYVISCPWFQSTIKDKTQLRAIVTHFSSSTLRPAGGRMQPRATRLPHVTPQSVAHVLRETKIRHVHCTCRQNGLALIYLLRPRGNTATCGRTSSGTDGLRRRRSRAGRRWKDILGSGLVYRWDSNPSFDWNREWGISFPIVGLIRDLKLYFIFQYSVVFGKPLQ